MGFISLTERHGRRIGLNTRIIREIVEGPTCTTLVVDDEHYPSNQKTVIVQDSYPSVMEKIEKAEPKNVEIA